MVTRYKAIQEAQFLRVSDFLAQGGPFYERDMRRCQNDREEHIYEQRAMVVFSEGL